MPGTEGGDKTFADRAEIQQAPQDSQDLAPPEYRDRDQGRNLPLRFSGLRPGVLGKDKLNSPWFRESSPFRPERRPYLSFSQFFPSLRGVGRNPFPIGRCQKEELNFPGKTLIEIPQNRFPPFPRFSLSKILDFRKKGQKQGGFSDLFQKTFDSPGRLLGENELLGVELPGHLLLGAGITLQAGQDQNADDQAGNPPDNGHERKTMLFHPLFERKEGFFYHGAIIADFES